MLSKRELASRLIRSLGLTQALGTLRSALVHDLRVLAYHRVLADFDEATFPFDAELVSARQEEFDWQMAYVARRFQPVSCRQVADAIRSGEPLPKRAVMVTFDDGFRDNYEVAFPVLRRHGVPALFFVTTGYMNTQRVFWFDWLFHVLQRTRETHIRLEILDLTIDVGVTPTDRRAGAWKLLRVLKRTPESLRLQALQQLEQAAGVELSAADQGCCAIMSWDQVREMSRAGMEFGSHTVSHPILSTITDPASLWVEIGESKATLEREIGRPVIAFAYPVGGSGAINERVLAAVAESGYEFAFTYEPGASQLSFGNRFLLKRIPVERYITRDMFAAALELPGIFVH